VEAELRARRRGRALGALAVDGGFADLTHRTPVADPAIATGQQLAVLLARRRHGRGRNTRAARRRHAKSHVDSAPLGDVVGEMLSTSDNSPPSKCSRDRDAARAPPATTEMGNDGVRALDALRIPHKDPDARRLRARTGDRVGCPTLLGVIELTNQSRFAAIDRGLPVAGRSARCGPLLGDRLAGVLGENRVDRRRRPLAGTVDAGPNPDFAFIANGVLPGGRECPTGRGGARRGVISVSHRHGRARACPLIGTAPRLRLARE
jgi:hypothetical protein